MKCDFCGLESDFDAAFVKDPTALPFSKKTVCASCSVKRVHQTELFLLQLVLAAGVCGGILRWLAPESTVGKVLWAGFFVAVFAVATIVPHELGHALVGRLMGWDVHRITIGVGPTLMKWRRFGVLFDLRLIPLTGATWVMPKDMRGFRWKRFLLTLAGPVVNAALALATLLIWGGGVGHVAYDALPLLPRLFFWVNVWVLAINLWPFQPKGGFGLPTDGKQLLQTLSFRKKTMDEVRALQFALEATLRREQGDLASARSACDRGLALYPEDPHLLSLSGVNYLDEHRFELARDVFLKLIDKKDQPPSTRFLFLNNLAYADALSENPDWLAEADAYSKDAYAALPWIPAIVATRGTVLVALGQSEEGMSLLKKSMDDDNRPSSRGENACHLAIALARDGRIAEARKYLELARQLYPQCRLIERAQGEIGERN